MCGRRRLVVAIVIGVAFLILVGAVRNGPLPGDELLARLLTSQRGYVITAASRLASVQIWTVLVLVVQGRAKPSLLDTYHDERIGIATRLVRITDRAFNYVNSGHPLQKEAARLHLLPLVLPLVAPIALRQRFLRQVVFRTISQICIKYRDSVLSQEADDASFQRAAPQPGDRVPYVRSSGRFTGSRGLVSGTKFHLVLFPGAAPDTDLEHVATESLQGFADLVECHDVSLTSETRPLYRAFGVREDGFYLIRPDQHIAYRGQTTLQAGGLQQYLTTFFRPALDESS